jgi:hypothetical protein
VHPFDPQRAFGSKKTSFHNPSSLTTIAPLEHEFTIDGGEFAPSLKVKGRVINEKYKGVFDARNRVRAAGGQ